MLMFSIFTLFVPSKENQDTGQKCLFAKLGNEKRKDQRYTGIRYATRTQAQIITPKFKKQ